MSKARDIADSGGGGKSLLGTKFLIQSGSYTLTGGNVYRIIAVGAGGAGGSSVYAGGDRTKGSNAAQGGCSGAVAIKVVSPDSDTNITMSMGAGGIGVLASISGVGSDTQTGGNGGATTVVGTGINLNAGGGQGGQASVNTGTGAAATLSALSGPTATGGDTNIDGSGVGQVDAAALFYTVQNGAGYLTPASAVSGQAPTGNNDSYSEAAGTSFLPYLPNEASGGGGQAGCSTTVNHTRNGGSGDYGCGGGGAVSRTGTTSTGATRQANGGDGGQGFVIIYEYGAL